MQTTSSASAAIPSYLIDHHELRRILNKAPRPENVAEKQRPAQPEKRAADTAWWIPRYTGTAESVKPATPRGYASAAQGFGAAPRTDRLPPEQWALTPAANLVTKALEMGRGQRLLAKWDELVASDAWASLPAKFAEARASHPGGALETYLMSRAAQAGFEIKPVSRARALRDRLQASDVADAPTLDMAV